MIRSEGVINQTFGNISKVKYHSWYKCVLITGLEASTINMSNKWPLESKQANETKQKNVMNEEFLHGGSTWSRECINIWNNKHVTILRDVRFSQKCWYRLKSKNSIARPWRCRQHTLLKCNYLPHDIVSHPRRLEVSSYMNIQINLKTLFSWLINYDYHWFELSYDGTVITSFNTSV